MAPVKERDATAKLLKQASELGLQLRAVSDSGRTLPVAGRNGRWILGMEASPPTDMRLKRRIEQLSQELLVFTFWTEKPLMDWIRR